MNLAGAIRVVRETTSLEDDGQFAKLEQAVATIAEAQGLPGNQVGAIFELFERFDGEDDFGLFRTLLHAVERTSGYEPLLLDSLRRRPCEFNLRILRGLSNAGFTHLSSASIASLAEVIRDDPRVAHELRRVAGEIHADTLGNA